MGDKDINNEGQQTTRRMSTRATRMKMKTTRMRRTRMRTRGDDDKEDYDEGQQGVQGTTTRMWDKDVDNEGHWTTRRDEYTGNTRTTRTQDEDTTIKNRTRTMRDDDDEG